MLIETTINRTENCNTFSVPVTEHSISFSNCPSSMNLDNREKFRCNIGCITEKALTCNRNKSIEF